MAYRGERALKSLLGIWKANCVRCKMEMEMGKYTLSGREMESTLGSGVGSMPSTSVGVVSVVKTSTGAGSESVFDSTRTAPAAPVAARYAVRDVRSWKFLKKRRTEPASTYCLHSEHHGVG